MTDYDKAIADCNEAIRLDPKLASAYSNRGIAWGFKKNFDKAIADYNEVIRLVPGNPGAYNALAWIWATCPEERLRDGKRAVELATHVCELTEWKYANPLDTLAAAYAEVGDFEKAVERQEKAIQLTTDARNKQEYQDRLKLYQQRKPYREEDK